MIQDIQKKTCIQPHIHIQRRDTSIFFFPVLYDFFFFVSFPPKSGLVINNVEDDHVYLCNTNKLELFSNIVGTSPVIRQPVITYSKLRLTSLALTVVNQFTVAFVGTEDGRLKKVMSK